MRLGGIKNLKYYARERALWPKLDLIEMPVLLAPYWSERVLEQVGYQGHVRYHLRPRGDNHCYDTATRTVYYSGPTVSVSDMLHELGHIWVPYHNRDHLTAVCLLVEIYKETH